MKRKCKESCAQTLLEDSYIEGACYAHNNKDSLMTIDKYYQN